MTDAHIDGRTDRRVGQNSDLDFSIKFKVNSSIIQFLKFHLLLRFLFQRLLKSVKSKLVKKQSHEVKGPVRSRLQWIDMTNRIVTFENGTQSNTCSPALGYSFAAGTTDGPGEFDFTQGANTTNPFWDFVSGLIKDPSPEQEACHAPKPILLDTGEVKKIC